jgi:hypothetical protein
MRPTPKKFAQMTKFRPSGHTGRVYIHSGNPFLALTTWSNGVCSVCRVVGREIESRQDICRAVPLKKRTKFHFGLAAWSSGIVSACRAMGREIESHLGICRVVDIFYYKWKIHFWKKSKLHKMKWKFCPYIHIDTKYVRVDFLPNDSIFSRWSALKAAVQKFYIFLH